MDRAAAIIVAAGRGTRFGGDKLFRLVRGRSVLHWTLAAFEQCAAIDTITLVVSEESREAAEALVAGAGFNRVAAIVPGGAERQESVFNGLRAAPPAPLVAVHDGARPLIAPALIARCVEAAGEHGAAAPALRVADTLKRTDPEGWMRETVDRRPLRAIQTPQVFEWSLLWEAHEAAARAGFAGTDDASLVERLGHPVFAVPGDPRNLKVTTPEDLALAEALLAAQTPDEVNRTAMQEKPSPEPRNAGTPERRNAHPPCRTGFGYDVHRLVAGRPLVLGGVTIPHPYGLEGHSDADVLSHAIGDALLGAAALGDLGRHFPDTDSRWKDVSSLDLLRRITALASAAGWAPLHVDATLLAEAPKIAPHIGAMAERIGAALGLPPAAVSLKATTTEGLGFIGRREGMAAQAVVTAGPVTGRGSTGDAAAATQNPSARLGHGRED
jgi:2-C-methyl-D-erythritol 4-phosphate cytidylyltransferase/2-C-methyl-D-erythritol 2,4-cyclodiphosphate synthase